METTRQHRASRALGVRLRLRRKDSRPSAGNDISCCHSRAKRGNLWEQSSQLHLESVRSTRQTVVDTVNGTQLRLRRKDSRPSAGNDKRVAGNDIVFCHSRALRGNLWEQSSQLHLESVRSTRHTVVDTVNRTQLRLRRKDSRPKAGNDKRVAGNDKRGARSSISCCHSRARRGNLWEQSSQLHLESVRSARHTVVDAYDGTQLRLRRKDSRPSAGNDKRESPRSGRHTVDGAHKSTRQTFTGGAL
jgi:cell division protein FtsL